MSLEFYSSVAKSHEVIKFWGLFPSGSNGKITGRRSVKKPIQMHTNFDAEIQTENSEHVLFIIIKYTIDITLY